MRGDLLLRNGISMASRAEMEHGFEYACEDDARFVRACLSRPETVWVSVYVW